MFSRGYLPGSAFVLLACCGVSHADPFAPAVPSQPEAGAVVRPLDYRVIGVVVSGSRTAAVIQMPNGQIATLRPGDRIGNAEIDRITPAGVALDTGQGIVRLPLAD